MFQIGQEGISGDISLGGVFVVFYTIWGQCSLGPRPLRYDKPAGVTEQTHMNTLVPVPLCLDPQSAASSCFVFFVTIPIFF